MCAGAMQAKAQAHNSPAAEKDIRCIVELLKTNVSDRVFDIDHAALKRAGKIRVQMHAAH